MTQIFDSRNCGNYLRNKIYAKHYEKQEGNLSEISEISGISLVSREKKLKMATFTEASFLGKSST